MNQKNHIAHAVKYGLILAVLRALLDISIKYFDANATLFNLSAIIGLVLEFIIVFYAIKVFQLKVKEITVKDAVRIGVIMTMITSALLFLSINFYHPEYAQNKLIELTKKVQPDQLEVVLENIKQAKENPNYFSNFATTLVKFIMIGAVIGFISGLIISTKQIKKA